MTSDQSGIPSFCLCCSHAWDRVSIQLTPPPSYDPWLLLFLFFPAPFYLLFSFDFRKPLRTGVRTLAFNVLGHFISCDQKEITKKINRYITKTFTISYLWGPTSPAAAFIASACVLAKEETRELPFSLSIEPMGYGRPPLEQRLCLTCVCREKERESKSGERDRSTFQLAVWRLPSNRCGSFSLPGLLYSSCDSRAFRFFFFSTLPIRMI